MANQIPENIPYDDVALLAPLMVATAKSHHAALNTYLKPALGTDWLAMLEIQAQSLADAIDALAREERETRELSLEVEGIVAKLPAWRRHILTLAELAYEDHPKRAKYMRDLGRGKPLAIISIGPVRNYLQQVVPEVRAHRAALLAVGGDASTVDCGAAWAEQLSHLKIEVARERAEDAEASATAATARDALVSALRTLITAANASEWHNPETERAITAALEEGYRKIRKRTAPARAVGEAPVADDEGTEPAAGEQDTLPPADE